MEGCAPLLVKKSAEEDVYRDIARVPEVHRKDRKGKMIEEGNVCRLTCEGRSTYVLLRGKGDEAEGAIWLDERTRNRLGITAGSQRGFEFCPAGIWGQTCWAWSASDPSYRVSARLAVLSLALGVAGLLLGLLSIWLSVRH